MTSTRRRRWADGCELLDAEAIMDVSVVELEPAQSHKEWWICPEELRSSKDCIDVDINGERMLACAY